MTTELIPPNHLIELIGGGGPEGYKTVGRDFLEIFREYGGLKPTHRILEVGCGCGSMAMPLTSYLTTGSFEGFDIVPESIRWCQENITPRWPNFTFQHSALFNFFYNPEGRIQAKNYRFPYPDDSFDLTVLISVFTHMLPDDLAHYTREIARTLRPDGTALITFFILNEESLRLQDMEDSQVRFQHPFADAQVFVTDPARPETVMAYPEGSVRRALKENGLRLREPIHFGSWCGRTDTVTFQDLTVSHKA